MIKIDGLYVPYVDAELLTVMEIGEELQEECCRLYFPECIGVLNEPSTITCYECLYSRVFNNTPKFIKFAKENWS